MVVITGLSGSSSEHHSSGRPCAALMSRPRGRCSRDAHASAFESGVRACGTIGGDGKANDF
jgi:hypothetical protein